MKEEIPYELIAAYFVGETTGEQNKTLYEWLDRSSGNQKIFKELEDAWGASFVSVRNMAESERVIRKKVLSTSRKRIILKPVLRAASLIGAVTAGFLGSILINKKVPADPVALVPSGEVTLTTLPGQKSEATLPDGTKVWLNSETTISYPASYGIEGRFVKLQGGEIYLNVSKDETRPFILDTGDGLVKVHGTSFDVRNYGSDQMMSVSLEEGSIEFFASDNSEKTMIVPGQRLDMDKGSGSMILQRCKTEVESIWRFGEMKIEREKFMEVMDAIERWYGVEIEVTGNIPWGSYYWMTIKTESLREMLSLLGKITPISYRIDGKNVFIKVK